MWMRTDATSTIVPSARSTAGFAGLFVSSQTASHRTGSAGFSLHRAASPLTCTHRQVQAMAPRAGRWAVARLLAYENRIQQGLADEGLGLLGRGDAHAHHHHQLVSLVFNPKRTVFLFVARVLEKFMPRLSFCCS